MNSNYTPLYKKNQLLYGTGKLIIVTGWTLKEYVAKLFKDTEYASIGQLYSPTRGINYLVRNLLANPNFNYLVAISATPQDDASGAVECLYDFIHNGYIAGVSDANKPCWRIKSAIKGYIDKEVTEQGLNYLRQNLHCWLFSKLDGTSLNTIKELAKEANEVLENRQIIYPVQTRFPMANYTTTNNNPDLASGHVIRGKRIADIWPEILHRIINFGYETESGYDSNRQELINLIAIIEDEPEFFYIPDHLPIKRKFVESYIDQVVYDHLYTKEDYIKYTYGQRMRSHFKLDQIETVIKKLAENTNSASAVISLWDVIEDNQNIKDSPCLTNIWVKIIANKLTLTATFRSNDMYSAWLANAIGLRALQQYILKEIKNRQSWQGAELDIRLGNLTIISQSAHIYSEALADAKLIVDQHYTFKNKFDDVIGSFVIYLSDKEQSILVDHITTGSGEVLKTFKGKSAKKLYKDLANSFPQIEAEHALYLGTELQKAEIALKYNLEYMQDVSIKFN